MPRSRPPLLLLLLAVSVAVAVMVAVLPAGFLPAGFLPAVAVAAAARQPPPPPPPPPSAADLEATVLKAKDALRNNKYSDSLKLYDSYIKHRKDDVSARLVRSFLFNKIGRLHDSLRDLDHIISVQPIPEAHLKKADALIQMNKLTDAVTEINNAENLCSKNPTKFSKADHFSEISDLKNKISDVEKKLAEINVHVENSDHENAFARFKDVLSVVTHDHELRKQHLELLLSNQQFARAISEANRLSQFTRNLDYYALLAELYYYSMYSIEASRAAIRKCMASDPEHRGCFAVHKTIKRCEKAMGDVRAHLESAPKSGDSDYSKNPAPPEMIESLAAVISDVEAHKRGPIFLAGLMKELHSAMCQGSRSVEVCLKALEVDKECLDCVIALVDAHVKGENFDEAVRVLSRASETFPNNQRIMQLQAKVQRQQRMAARVDHYKVLELSRDASERDIKRNFRKLAKEYHPDKYSGKMTKEQIQDKMSKINNAYRILSNEKLRRQYDNGIDPDDPHSGGQQYGGEAFYGNPFGGDGGGGGGFPFPFFHQGGGGGGEGGGGHFKFNF